MPTKWISADPLVMRHRIRAQVLLACVAVVSAIMSILVAPNIQGALGALLACVMLAIAATDARHGIIPDELNATALTMALADIVLKNPDGMAGAMAAAVSRGGVLALAFLGLQLGYRHLRGRDGIGLGDVKLAVVAGAWLDWLTLPITVEIAALAGLATYVGRQYWFRRPLHPTARLPFGLFFAPAIWLGWLIEAVALVPR